MKIKLIVFVIILFGGAFAQQGDSTDKWFEPWRERIINCPTVEELVSLRAEFEKENVNNPLYLLKFYSLYREYTYRIADREFKRIKTREQRLRLKELLYKSYKETETFILKMDKLCAGTPDEKKDEDLQSFCGSMRKAAKYIYFKRDLKTEPAPDFTFTDLQGVKRRLSEFKGRYVLLHFWNRHSVPCMEELDNLRRAYLQFKEKNLEIISVYIGFAQDSWETQVVKNLIKEKGLNWIHVLGAQTEEIKAIYFIRNYPTLYLLDPRGFVIKQEKELREENLNAALAKILR
ncbi:MAG: redoxin domain-containing protein [Calditrichaeota bacterium]|nr:redoxin domain-containing protein [Calditrichota bacterium]